MRGKQSRKRQKLSSCISGVPRNFVRGGGCSTNSVEDRVQGYIAVAPYSWVLEAAVIS